MNAWVNRHINDCLWPSILAYASVFYIQSITEFLNEAIQMQWEMNIPNSCNTMLIKGNNILLHICLLLVIVDKYITLYITFCTYFLIDNKKNVFARVLIRVTA